ncbi:MAG: aminoglycoside phosphotransferase family protein [Eubacterium sp.]|nr:aminoglycoside phosphotransferase family protein [Eubacterium sp.]
MDMKMILNGVCPHFINGTIISAKALGDGNINDTYLIKTPNQDYICQRIKKEMDIEKLEYNYKLYSKACQENSWLYPTWMPSDEGGYFHIDKSAYAWRMYPFIRGQILKSPLSEESYMACGRGLYKMHLALADIKGRPKAVYPHLHDLKYYYEKYIEIINEKPDIKKDFRDSDIETIINRESEFMLNIDLGPEIIVHGDSKLSNIIFNNGKFMGFIDFDTVMQGYMLEDIADCVRSCCLTEGKLNMNAAHNLVEAYVSMAPAEVKEVVLNGWQDVFYKICFELGLRYYIDVISGEMHFKEKTPGYRLDKARALLNYKAL